MRKISWVVNNPAHSSKGERLLELVHEAVCNNKKIIIFSFYLDTIKTVKRILDVKTFGPINGSISPSRRQAIIDDFSKNKGGAVLLSQIQAGGTGLNIQAASVIIFCEPQLKPSIENQAIGRAYRMGQVDTVMVYHLLCEKTVDERINELLKNKQELFDNFADISVSGDESLITNNEIENMVEEERIRWGTTA
jgi:SNF2 family DNA or RNA helicase